MLLTKLNIFKTIFYNYHFFGLKGLRRLPIYVYRHVIFKDIKKRIVYNGPLTRGCIRFGGTNSLATKDIVCERTIVDISGTLVLEGPVHFAPGCRVSIDDGGVLTIGAGFNTSGNVTIICHKNISIGSNCLFAWDIQIMDADFHNIYDQNNRVINSDKPVKIGDHVWVGCKVLILKGSHIPDGCVVGAGSLVTKSFDVPNALIAGSGKCCEVIKTNIKWQP